MQKQDNAAETVPLTDNYYPPSYGLKAFHCPRCYVYAKQEWFGTYTSRKVIAVPGSRNHIEEHNLTEALYLEVSRCAHCHKYSIWLEEALLYPASIPVPQPHKDMPSEVSELYNESAQVLFISPRAAAALLRLALQKLLEKTGGKGKNINSDIEFLVRSGKVTTNTQRALDVLRVLGNNAVHPGEINLNEDPEHVKAMFAFMNYVVDGLISQEKQINKLFESLPDRQRNSIKKRDKKEGL